VLSICPPHGALATARAVGALEGLYVDANAVSPPPAAEISRAVVQEAGARYVDGGIIGPPPEGPQPHGAPVPLRRRGPAVAAVFAGTGFETPCSTAGRPPPRR
jgi:hypothetical protein